MASPPADSGPESSKSGTVKTLRAELQNLAERSDEIEKQKAEILDELYRLKLSNPSPVPDVVPSDVQVIAFVKALRKANEFFEFKDYLERRVPYIRHDSDNLKCFKSLVKSDRVQDIFTKLDFQDILDAVNERILHLQIEEDPKLKQAINNYSPDSKEDYKPFTLMRYAKKGGGPVLNAIVKLVYHVREKGYVMNRDPWEEIDLMKKHNPYFYEHSFIKGLLEKFSEKTVKVYNVPVKFGERKVKASFRDCGGIESVKFEGMDDWSKVAYITFKSSEGANLAPILKGEFLSVEPLQEESPKCHPYTRSELIQALDMYKTFQDSKSSKGSQTR